MFLVSLLLILVEYIGAAKKGQPGFNSPCIRHSIGISLRQRSPQVCSGNRPSPGVYNCQVSLVMTVGYAYSMKDNVKSSNILASVLYGKLLKPLLLLKNSFFFFFFLLFRQIRLYDTGAQRRPMLMFDYGESPIKSIAPGGDGNTVYVGSGSGDLACFDMRTG